MTEPEMPDRSLTQIKSWNVYRVPRIRGALPGYVAIAFWHDAHTFAGVAGMSMWSAAPFGMA
jgi:hypothetical protein